MYVPAVRSVQFLAVCLLLCGACPGAYAVQSLEFRLGAVSGDGWSASGVELVVEWLDSSTFHTTLRAERVQFPAPLGQLDGVTVQCPQTLFDGVELVCRQGGLQAVSGRLGPQQAGLSFRYRPGDRKLHLELRSLHYLAGRLSLQADYAQQGWAVQLQGAQLAQLL